MENTRLRLKPYPLGWRAKFGMLTPSHDEGYGSYEFDVMCPDGVVCLDARVSGRAVTVDQLQLMAEDALHEAEKLNHAHPDIIDFIPTAPCFVIGVEKEAALINEIAAKTGVKSTAGGQSVAVALKFMGTQKVILYTPYNTQVQEANNRYFQDSGFEVLGYQSLQFERPGDINRVSPHEIASDIIKLYQKHPQAEGVFVVGGCFRTLEIVDMVEQIIGIPIVGTQQANMWHCLKLCGIGDPLTGFGKLLAVPRL